MFTNIQDLFVKICGITRGDDARHAVLCGADAVGFMFDRTDARFIQPHRAAEITRSLPDRVSKIGVFVNAEQKFIRKVLSVVPLSAVQLLGREGPDDLVNYETSVIKAFRLTPGFDVEMLRNYIVDAFLIDARRVGESVGAGIFDWNVAVRAKEYGRVILSGGLTPENVEEAVRYVQPYGVDATEGVEQEPGKKDPMKVKEFIMRAKSVRLYYNEPNEE